MTQLPADSFRTAMQAHGLVLRDDQLDDDNIADELWRLHHLQAMARLALRADPTLQISETFSPGDLYVGLAAVIALEESAVFTISELLRALARLEHRHAPDDALEDALEDEPSSVPLVPPWEDGDPTELGDQGLDEYIALLQVALEACAAARPWRLGQPRAAFQRPYLVSTPPDRFRGPAPGVIPDLDQIDFSDVLTDEE